MEDKGGLFSALTRDSREREKKGLGVLKTLYAKKTTNVGWFMVGHELLNSFNQRDSWPREKRKKKETLSGRVMRISASELKRAGERSLAEGLYVLSGEREIDLREGPRRWVWGVNASSTKRISGQRSAKELTRI